MIPARIEQIFDRIRDISHRFEDKPVAGQTGPDKPLGTSNPMENSGSHPTEKVDPEHGESFATTLDNLIRESSIKHGVNENLIRAVIDAESSGNEKAVSPKGAIGLMQIMPETAEYLKINPYEARENLDGGVRYLKELAGQFNSLDEVLAAYNAGPGKVRQYGGVPPYRETRDYIEKIRGSIADFRR